MRVIKTRTKRGSIALVPVARAMWPSAPAGSVRVIKTRTKRGSIALVPVARAMWPSAPAGSVRVIKTRTKRGSPEPGLATVFDAQYYIYSCRGNGRSSDNSISRCQECERISVC